MSSSFSSEISDLDHQRVADFMHSEVGIQLPKHKRKLIETRLRKRIILNNLVGIKDYLDYVFSPQGSEERTAMIDTLTTNKTDFFREVEHFERLNSLVHSGQFGNFAERGALQIWSAACSAGQEPYSLAMVLSRLQQQVRGLQFGIWATDICTEVIQTARRGIYSDTQITGIPEDYRKDYLLKSENKVNRRYKVSSQVRQTVRFDLLNLKQGRYPKTASMDVIFCRNVLIYFSAHDRNLVITRLAHCLKPGGILVLGHSESLTPEAKVFFTPIGPTMHCKK